MAVCFVPVELPVKLGSRCVCSFELHPHMGTSCGRGEMVAMIGDGVAAFLEEAFQGKVDG